MKKRSGLVANVTAVAFLGSLLLSCKQRQFNEKNTTVLSDSTDPKESAEGDAPVPREELPENKLPNCSAYGVTLLPSVAYQTPEGALKPWTASNSLISTYQQANGMFPQINFAIQIFMMDHLLRDPYLNVKSMHDAKLTDTQWQRIAKVMTSLHKAHGVKWHSLRFLAVKTPTPGAEGSTPAANAATPAPNVQIVPDQRVKDLISGAMQGALTYAHASLLRFAVADETRTGPVGAELSSPLSPAFEAALHAEYGPITQAKRCSLTSVVGLMRDAFSSKEVRAVNEVWKAKITSGEKFNRRHYYQNEIRTKLKPVFEARMITPLDKEAFDVIWENLTY